MKLLGLLGASTLVLLSGFVYRMYDQLTRPLPVPVLDTDRYWGRGNGTNYKTDTSIKTFVLKRSAEEIADLRTQLERPIKFTPHLEGINFEYGMNINVLEHIVKYWRDDYLPRWTEREAFLNALPQYTTEIQGLRIHYIHSKPSLKVTNKKILPLLLLHGWGGSVREFYDIIALLNNATDQHDFVFEVIAPSLVGFGWSQAATKPGCNYVQMAIIMHKLMLRLGHQKFLVQGGDFGSLIGSALATLYPEQVLGYHSNMCVLQTPLAFVKNIIASWLPDIFLPSRLVYEHHFPLSQKFSEIILESGYYHLQATKPDTIGLALAQNPIALVAYILEKFQLSTGPILGQSFTAIADVYTLDAMLDNIMIYYLSNTITSSVRFYAENMSRETYALQLDRVQSLVPMACAHFRHDLPTAMDWQLLDKFPNLVQSTYFNDAGHFAAMEVPVILYTDFVEFVNKINL